MSDTAEHAAPALGLARTLRRALAKRAEDLAPAIAEYDKAVSLEDRLWAGAVLMAAANAADADFHMALREALKESQDS